MINGFLVREAVNSVAIEHPEDCDCTTCRAADGDTEAFVTMYREILHGDRDER